MSAQNIQTEMTFWDHLDELRRMLFRSAIAVFAMTAVVLCFKSLVFDGFVLAPSRSDFFIYRWLGLNVVMNLINIDISAQFFIHLKVSLAVGFVCSFPYIIYQIWSFIAPALYDDEIKAFKTAFLFSSFLFYLGAAVGYFFVLPVCLNFFMAYSVSDSVQNSISLNSYISMFVSLVLLIGIVFEFPAVIAVLSKLGLVKRDGLKKYRKHAFIVMLFVSALITPADPVSMFVLAVPLYLLYETSVLICR